MRLEYPYRTERFGAVRINELQRVIEIDCGARTYDDQPGPSRVISREALQDIERELAIVVPCMNESRRVIEGVLSGIPHDCLIILVSNSDRSPVDRYDLEIGALEQFCRLADRPALAVHQRDPGLAASFKSAGMPELLDDAGLVHHGKGEAMLVGMALAAMTSRRYVGYIDSDNYVPGAVHEYCKVYAAGLAMTPSPYAMVRISWHSKPKVRDNKLFFSRRGRSSEVTNQFLNRLLAEYSGFGTDAVVTGNAGEHAISLELGMRMRMAGGFAVEPFHFVELFEQFGGVLPTRHAEVMGQGVEVWQVESRNPHFHDNKGDDHVTSMRTQALNVIYHSEICPPGLKEQIVEFLGDQSPPRERIYPAVGTLALDRLYDAITCESETFKQVVQRLPARVRTVTPLQRT
ncbi:mannosyl-3-phosphoglycerate synthase [Rhizocola hellebori]|uniref:Mannosyl-3-phosphoglycerate synthase n=1 Tax=Rhizocola hellebori TaxID=1392758 RepID=A0A8J3VG70_9ACTN|nr:mannosyl-3-phosphoglycerate synthase [Rhizocola hellebori]GIH04558.1 mannosyl-3-phosphoglycerate synthase [Rhizocola hellebori]